MPQWLHTTFIIAAGLLVAAVATRLLWRGFDPLVAVSGLVALVVSIQLARRRSKDPGQAG